MPHSVLLQDWLTVQGVSSAEKVYQPESDWADLGGYIDVVFYLDVRALSGSPTVRYQTSPTRDEAFFATMGSVGVTGTGLTQTVVRYASASVPLRRWVRWQIGGSSAFSLTFRVWATVRTG